MKTYVVPETKYYTITSDDLLQSLGVGSGSGSGWDDADAKSFDEENEDTFYNDKFNIWED